MHLSPTDIYEFQALWQKEFEEALSEDAVRSRAMELFELYRLLARIPPPEPTNPSHEILGLLS
jgi:hypothetical protein